MFDSDLLLEKYQQRISIFIHTKLVLQRDLGLCFFQFSRFFQLVDF